MMTKNNENYGRDGRNFHHPEDDIRSDPQKNNIYPDQISEENLSYVDQYQQSNYIPDQEEIVNQDNDITNDENQGNYLDNEFSNALERENQDDDYLKDTDPENDDLDEDDLYDSDEDEDEDEDDIDEDDIDDDLEEDYDENDRDIDSLSGDYFKTDELDQEYDIDQDLEEKDPVNNPRKF